MFEVSRKVRLVFCCVTALARTTTRTLRSSCCGGLRQSRQILSSFRGFEEGEARLWLWRRACANHEEDASQLLMASSSSTTVLLALRFLSPGQARMFSAQAADICAARPFDGFALLVCRGTLMTQGAGPVFGLRTATASSRRQVAAFRRPRWVGRCFFVIAGVYDDFLQRSMSELGATRTV